MLSGDLSKMMLLKKLLRGRLALPSGSAAIEAQPGVGWGGGGQGPQQDGVKSVLWLLLASPHPALPPQPAAPSTPSHSCSETVGRQN